MTARKIAAECGAYVNMNGVLFNTNVEFTAFAARIRAEATEDAAKDAARYRLLRDRAEVSSAGGGIDYYTIMVSKSFPPSANGKWGFNHASLDAAIDAAIRAQEGKNTARTAGHPLSGRAQDERPAGSQPERSAP